MWNIDTHSFQLFGALFEQQVSALTSHRYKKEGQKLT
jgi:hypothetical protein